jgi:hypothetical protein
MKIIVREPRPADRACICRSAAVMKKSVIM